MTGCVSLLTIACACVNEFGCGRPASLSCFLDPEVFCWIWMEAVVVFDYEKQQDDELNIKVGEIITQVTQEVCVVCRERRSSGRRFRAVIVCCVCSITQSHTTDTLSRWMMAGVRGPIRTERGGCFLTTLYS